MNDMLRELGDKGLSVFACPFTPETLAHWNAKLDPLFAARRNQGLRSYVISTELIDLGIAQEYFSPAMRALIRSVIPDAVLGTFECYETEGGMRESRVYDANTEWHRDIENLPGLRNADPNFCSVFIYLSDVGMRSGPFEFRPLAPEQPLKPGDPTIRVTGPIDTSFIWNRSFYHRAAMNETDVRRRVLKISIQHNYLENAVLISETFKAALAKIDTQDTYLRFLFGEKFASTHSGYMLPEISEAKFATVPTSVNASARTSKAWKFYRRVMNKLWKMF